MDHNYSTGRTFIVTQCEEKLTAAPAAPVQVNAEDAGNGQVRVTWLPAAGTPLNTTYELYVRTEDGRLLGNCRAYVDGSRNGLRKVEEAGNRGTATTALLSLPDGNYTVGVQAVDGRRVGSAFCTCDFSVTYEQETALPRPAHAEPDSAGYYVTGQPASRTADDGIRHILVRKGRKILSFPK